MSKFNFRENYLPDAPAYDGLGITKEDHEALQAEINAVDISSAVEKNGVDNIKLCKMVDGLSPEAKTVWLATTLTHLIINQRRPSMEDFMREMLMMED